MSAKRTRKTSKPTSAAALTPEPTEGQSAVGAELEKIFDAIFEYVRERDEAKARALAARPKAEIIPFHKARH